MNDFDIIVIGGGPAGMMAAGHAADWGAKVLLLEKNADLGAKLKLTGGGRCNITNAEFDIRSFLSAFGENKKFLFSPFSRFSVQETFDFFEEEGLLLTVESQRRAFPTSGKAVDVISTLENFLVKNGVIIRKGSSVTDVEIVSNDRVMIRVAEEPLFAKSVVLATGGLAYPKTGSTGDGLRWLKKLGFLLHPSEPTLVPLCVKDSWIKNLSGLTLEKVGIKCEGSEGSVFLGTGSILFTHFGVSGPLILNRSNQIKEMLKGGEVVTSLDLFPDEDASVLEKRILGVFDENKNKLLRNVLGFVVPKGGVNMLRTHLPEGLLDKQINGIRQEERKFLIKILKGLPFRITKTMGYDWAIVSDGGIDLADVNTQTMATRKYPNLFVVGDLLHVSRPSGGFSLQLCWTTGWVAGEEAFYRSTM